MFGLGAGELFLIFIIALLFLGPKKLPELAKGLGQAMREFQKAKENVVTEIHKGAQDKAEETKISAVPEKTEPESPKHS